MNVLSVVTQAIASAIRAAGDAIVDVKVAGAVQFEAEPGVDYEPSWSIATGKGFFEKVEVTDYPGTEFQVSDVTMVLMQCAYDVDMHDYVLVGGKTYHVHGVKPDIIGSTRVLQKLLLRPENRSGIAWDSVDLAAA